MTFKKIDHIGIAVPNLENAVEFYQKLFGKTPNHFEEVEEQKVRTAFFEVGEVNLELLFPTAEDSPIGKFLEKRNGGLHHICFEVTDIEQHLENLKKQGITLIDEKPRIGAHGKRIAFVHPKSTGGVLIELSERIES